GAPLSRLGSASGLGLAKHGPPPSLGPLPPRLRDSGAKRSSRETRSAREPPWRPGRRLGRMRVCCLGRTSKTAQLADELQEDALISSSVAGGLKLCSVLILRHIRIFAKFPTALTER